MIHLHMSDVFFLFQSQFPSGQCSTSRFFLWTHGSAIELKAMAICFFLPCLVRCVRCKVVGLKLGLQQTFIFITHKYADFTFAIHRLVVCLFFQKMSERSEYDNINVSSKQQMFWIFARKMT